MPGVPVLSHKLDIFEFMGGLLDGDALSWITLGAILGIIAFFALYQKVTGRSFVKSKKERRAWRESRHHVLWKYERDR